MVALFAKVHTISSQMVNARQLDVSRRMESILVFAHNVMQLWVLLSPTIDARFPTAFTSTPTDAVSAKTV
jgi:hypothetical protein